MGARLVVWGFRDEYMRRLGLDSNAQPLPGANDVVFVARTSQHRAWYDAERAQAYLENEFRDRGVQVRRPLEFNTLPMKLQVELVSTARVLVTFPGGSSYIAMFLPRGSTLIFVFSHESDGRQDYPLWGNLAHVNVVWIEGNYSSSSREVVFDHAQLSRAVETALLYQ